MIEEDPVARDVRERIEDLLDEYLMRGSAEGEVGRGLNLKLSPTPDDDGSRAA